MGYTIVSGNNWQNNTVIDFLNCTGKMLIVFGRLINYYCKILKLLWTQWFLRNIYRKIKKNIYTCSPNMFWTKYVKKAIHIYIYYCIKSYSQFTWAIKHAYTTRWKGFIFWSEYELAVVRIFLRFFQTEQNHSGRTFINNVPYRRSHAFVTNQPRTTAI